ncbi:hypothetical protein HZS_1191 [Henneguya salminicola]|nr:hypothetical protein HZS_1191 [Henneguya salminicola]
MHDDENEINEYLAYASKDFAREQGTSTAKFSAFLCAHRRKGWRFCGWDATFRESPHLFV